MEEDGVIAMNRLRSIVDEMVDAVRSSRSEGLHSQLVAYCLSLRYQGIYSACEWQRMSEVLESVRPA